MASAAASKRRGTAYAVQRAAKERRQKVFAGVGLVVLAAVLAFEVPRTLKMLKGTSSVAASSRLTTPARASERTLSKLFRGGVGSDPFAARALPDGDPPLGAAGGPDPFTAPGATAAAAAPKPLPQQIVIGRPGSGRVAKHGWIVILASIPTATSRTEAVRFARQARPNVGPLSILNSSHRRPLRGGYWVVYTGPYATQGAVARRAGDVHAAGYRTAYIRELITYR